MAKARVAINGFGRIGRLFFRAAFENENIEVVAINDLGDVENLAYLLKYDTVYRRWGKDVHADGAEADGTGEGSRVPAGEGPTQLPWKDMQVDIVIEATGFLIICEVEGASCGGREAGGHHGAGEG